MELGPRQTSLRQVLRWFLDNEVYDPETRRSECIYHAADVARSIWVDCGIASIRASVAFWRGLRIIRVERRSTPGGGKLPPRAWIDWRAVVSRCGGRVSDRGAVRGGPARQRWPRGGRVPSRPPRPLRGPRQVPSRRTSRLPQAIVAEGRNPGCHLWGP